MLQPTLILRSWRHGTAAAFLVATWLGLPPAGSAQGGFSTTTQPAKSPPFYRGSGLAVSTPMRLRVGVDHPADLPVQWLPTAALGKLAGDMDDWLAALSAQQLLEVGTSGGRARAPLVTLGCQVDFANECASEERHNVLQTSSGDRAWREAVRATLQGARAEGLLVINLQIAPHWIHQRNLRGSKEVRLGTRHVQRLPWLTSLDTPVWVVQVTGAVVDREGKVQRSGAEGIWALRTPMRISALGAQQMLQEEDIEELRTKIARDDLPGQPLAWQVALSDLIAGLTRPTSERG